MTASPWSSREAHYRCLQCLREWHGKAGPTQCPTYGHLYVKWLNYEDSAERIAKAVKTDDLARSALFDTTAAEIVKVK